MNHISQIADTMFISGRIGIVDAELVRFLQVKHEKTHELFVHAVYSLYPQLIPKKHIENFIGEITGVDGIIKDHAELSRTSKEPIHHILFPEQALAEYSRARILKNISIDDSDQVDTLPKLTTVHDLTQRYGALAQRQEIKLGLVTGVFDLIHYGHVQLLQHAKSMSDVVVAATMTTTAIKRLEKNSAGDRPIYSLDDRLALLAALRSVDYVLIFDAVDCREVLALLQPNIYVKHEKDLQRKIVQDECNLVKSYGGDVAVRRDKSCYSSTDIINFVRTFDPVLIIRDITNERSC